MRKDRGVELEVVRRRLAKGAMSAVLETSVPRTASWCRS